jgi:hypothetical protein
VRRVEPLPIDLLTQNNSKGRSRRARTDDPVPKPDDFDEIDDIAGEISNLRDVIKFGSGNSAWREICRALRSDSALGAQHTRRHQCPEAAGRCRHRPDPGGPHLANIVGGVHRTTGTWCFAPL